MRELYLLFNSVVEPDIAHASCQIKSCYRGVIKDVCVAIQPDCLCRWKHRSNALELRVMAWLKGKIAPWEGRAG